jgi:chloramphenicol 3-O-phosphotransferase
MSWLVGLPFLVLGLLLLVEVLARRRHRLAAEDERARRLARRQEQADHADRVHRLKVTQQPREDE